MSKNNIEGKTNFNNFGSYMVVIKDYNRDNINVYFPRYNWIAYGNTRGNFKIGQIKCPYEPRVLNIGYIGDGEYKTLDENGKTQCYKVWYSMLLRCYNKDFQNKNPTYIGCTVCEEWLNFQNFAKWYYNNIYNVNNECMHLDKDILCKGNKVYSPKTCVFVPQRINKLFTKRQNKRGNYPIGVNYHKRDDVLEVSCDIYKNNKTIKVYLGRFDPNEIDKAFDVYKQFKENYIKQIANEYKDIIPNKLYQALYSYQIEIND